MIHIVFNEADVAVIKEAIKLDDSLRGEVIQVKDDFAVGPLRDIYTEEGINARKQWWRDVLANSDIDGKVDDGTVDDQRTIRELKEKLQNNPDETVWIWAAQNKHDVSGYYWLMSQLADYQGKIYILYLNNLPFFNEKGNIFYPENLQQIPPKEFLKAKKLARPITLSEFEIDPDEWRKITEQDKYVRLLEGGKKLVQQEVDFYDEELKKHITAEWQKANKIISAFFHKAKHHTGDMFLLWRLKLILMMQSDDFEVQGNIRGMKDFEIRKKMTVEQTLSSQN